MGPGNAYRAMLSTAWCKPTFAGGETGVGHSPRHPTPNLSCKAKRLTNRKQPMLCCRLNAKILVTCMYGAFTKSIRALLSLVIDWQHFSNERSFVAPANGMSSTRPRSHFNTNPHSDHAHDEIDVLSATNL